MSAYQWADLVGLYLILIVEIVNTIRERRK